MTTVELVRWPAEADRRARLERAGRPRILVLADGIRPPLCGVLEDWVRRPVARADVEARAAALQVRASAASTVPAPELSDRLLRVGGRSLVLSAGESRLLHVLLERFGDVVDRDVLVDRLWPGGPVPRRNALDLRVLRLRRRLEPLGLTVRTVWGRGYLVARTGESAAAG